MQRRKALQFLFVFLTVVTFCLSSESVSAETLTTEDGFSYTKTQILSDYTVTITGYTGDASVLEIPETIEDYTVTTIAASVFEENTNLTSIVFPSGLKTMKQAICQNCTNLTDVTFTSSDYLSFGSQLFKGCTSLKNVTFSSKISKIGIDMFDGCTSLETITLPSTVTTIADQAFENCSSLSSITFGNKLTEIKGGAFNGCISLTELSLPESLTTIEAYAFKGCTGLTAVEIPENVTEISNELFYKCSNLMSVTLHSDITSIGKHAFQLCTNLTDFVIPNTVTSIGENAFKQCTSLKTVNIPDGITVLPKQVFDSCTGITSLTLPESLLIIENDAFYGCTGLTELVLPGNITTIGEHTFSNTSLKKVVFKGNYPVLSENSFYNVIADGYYPSTWTVVPEKNFCMGTFTWHVYGEDADVDEPLDEYTYTISDEGEVTVTSYNWTNEEVAIPDTIDGFPVVGIGEKAFFNNTTLEVLKLPKSLKQIDTEAFSGCIELKEVYFKNDDGIPSVGKNAFCNVEAKGYHSLHWNISPVSEFYGGTFDWENVEVVYLAMSDIAYRKSWSNYIGKELGTIEGGAGSLSSASLTNAHITKNMGLSWSDVYDQCLDSWTVQRYYDSDTTGLAAVVFQRDATNDVVIAFRGSQAFTNIEGMEDWFVDDFLMGLCNEMSPQMEDSVIFSKQVMEDNPGVNISATGHSLGGGLALLVSNALNIKTSGFDSAPTIDVGYYHMWDVMGNSFKGIDKWCYIDYLNEYCPVGNLEVGKKNYVKLSNLLANWKVLDTHARFTIIDYTDGNFRLSDEVSSKIYMTDDEWSNLVNIDYLIIPKGSLILGTSCNESLKGDNWKIHTEVLYGGEGNDALYGYNGDDCFIGGPGLDDLYGGNGDDKYIYFKGQGWDVIRDHQGNDTIKLYGFDSSDIIRVTDTDDYKYVWCDDEKILEISKNRSSLVTNSFVIEIINDKGEVEKTLKLQDWNQWKTVNAYMVACPVTIEIYNEQGESVLSLTDDSPEAQYTSYGNFFVSYNEETREYEKFFDLIEGYTFKIHATDNGTMDVSVTQFEEDGTIYIHSKSDIEIVKDQTYAVEEGSMEITGGEEPVKLESTVYIAPTSLSTSVSELQLEAGKQQEVTIAFEPTTTTETGVTWKSSDSTVATVENGIVKAISPGTATITVQSDVSNCYAAIVVTVTEQHIPIENKGSVDLEYTKVNYSGKIKTPSVIVKNEAGEELKEGVDYTVTYASGRIKTGRYKVTVIYQGDYTGSKDLYFTIVPKAPSSANATLTTYYSKSSAYDDVKVSWSEVTGASGYNIYYKKSTAVSYKYLTRTSKTYIRKKNLSDGVKYNFKIVPYYKSGDTRYTSLSYKTTSVYTLKKLSAPKISKSGSKVIVKWKNISGETGYQISKSTKKNATNIVSTYKTTKGTKKTISATKGKTYYYKVRAYKVVDGKKIYGPWSKVTAYKRK